MNEQHISDAAVLDSHNGGSNGIRLETAVSPKEEYAPHIGAGDALIQNQIERILHSDELRGCEALRRLLRLLADKSVCGQADELKEYIVAIDGLGKPSSYDPRKNSTVRIQVGRLRQKLADYYRTEG
jgi:hypothetical protein